MQKILVSLLVLLSLASSACSAPGRPQGKSRSSSNRPKNVQISVGVFEPASPVGGSSFEKTIGRRVALINVYQAWDSPHPDFDEGWVKLAQALRNNRQMLMITWEPWKAGSDFDQPKYRLKTIINGAHDKYMKRWFKAVGATKQPIFVRFAHEMNGFWYPWGTHVNQPSEYIAAWRHVVDLSREMGAENIIWVWSPNEHRDNDSLEKLYPGGKYVDWIGISGFNWGGPKNNEAGWRDASDIFGKTLALLKRHKKPIMIAETGSIESPQPHPEADKTKAAWIERTYAFAKSANPPIRLLIYQNDIFQNKYDWRVTTSPASQKAIKRAVADPRFKGMFTKELLNIK